MTINRQMMTTSNKGDDHKPIDDDHKPSVDGYKRLTEPFPIMRRRVRVVTVVGFYIFVRVK